MRHEFLDALWKGLGIVIVDTKRVIKPWSSVLALDYFGGITILFIFCLFFDEVFSYLISTSQPVMSLDHWMMLPNPRQQVVGSVRVRACLALGWEGSLIMSPKSSLSKTRFRQFLKAFLELEKVLKNSTIISMTKSVGVSTPQNVTIFLNNFVLSWRLLLRIQLMLRIYKYLGIITSKALTPLRTFPSLDSLWLSPMIYNLYFLFI